jgi:hypothetical protein
VFSHQRQNEANSNEKNIGRHLHSSSRVQLPKSNQKASPKTGALGQRSFPSFAATVCLGAPKEEERNKFDFSTKLKNLKR